MLEKINKPNDIHKIALADFPQLAEEIRQFLIESVSHTGGHLASNLGVVELTMALHQCSGISGRQDRMGCRTSGIYTQDSDRKKRRV